MKTVWKFEIPIADTWRVMMPTGAKVLSANTGSRNATIFAWAEIEQGESLEERGFIIVGTGNPMPKVGRFVDTVIDPPFVWHVYEEPAE